jgi:hypothetical protein
MLCHSISLHTLEYVHRSINILNDILYVYIFYVITYISHVKIGAHKKSVMSVATHGHAPSYINRKAHSQSSGEEKLRHRQCVFEVSTHSGPENVRAPWHRIRVHLVRAVRRRELVIFPLDLCSVVAASGSAE